MSKVVPLEKAMLWEMNPSPEHAKVQVSLLTRYINQSEDVGEEE